MFNVKTVQKNNRKDYCRTACRRGNHWNSYIHFQCICPLGIKLCCFHRRYRSRDLYLRDGSQQLNKGDGFSVSFVYLKLNEIVKLVSLVLFVIILIVLLSCVFLLLNILYSYANKLSSSLISISSIPLIS